ncbi:MAG: glutamine--tRNA ligase [Acidiferrobacteraceae bacterium]|nr:glutamine--tRNA ligase [Acidiferrobacteraceae bacterium]
MTEKDKTSYDATTPSHFINNIVSKDVKSGKFKGKVCTRFPPEPNGYLHIGHAKSICLNFGIAQTFSGKCHLRFDDTNPVREEKEYVQSIQKDLRWLGFDWEDRIFYASDNFNQLYEWAEQLIQIGKAYVDDLTPEEIREYRGTLTEPGQESPYRNRSVEENLDFFRRMRLGEFENGSKVLRAKIDMTSSNLNLRDPVLYRILKSKHHRTGDRWNIYPMYDFAHGQSDSIEGVTHSICTLEFEDHRPLYDWLLDQLDIYHPQQIEFARLNLTYTLLSKRKLLQLVEDKSVTGWDDPRMPTLSGLRRRGYTPNSIRDFCDRIGIAKANSTAEIQLLEHCLREDLNKRAPRVMAVLNPLKITIENYPKDKVEQLTAENNPEDLNAGTRQIPFTRELYIEREDFMEEPAKKFFRLAPGKEVRLKHAYIIRCERIIKNNAGEITELICSYDPESKSGGTFTKRKVKGTLHWVSVGHATNAEARLYDHLFNSPNPSETNDLKSILNPDSLKTLTGCKVEPVLANPQSEIPYQFLRMGYFAVDLDSKPGNLVFNRAVTLRDTWAKVRVK